MLSTKYLSDSRVPYFQIFGRRAIRDVLTYVTTFKISSPQICHFWVQFSNRGEQQIWTWGLQNQIACMSLTSKQVSDRSASAWSESYEPKTDFMTFWAP